MLFVVDGFVFCWITNFGDEFVVVDDDDVIGCTNVKRFFDKKTDWLELFVEDLSIVDISFVDDIVTLFNVWILGEVVPGGINVNNDDDVEFGSVEDLFTVVVLLCWGFNM